MANFTMKAGGTALPAPVEISSSGELIWSSNTGRSSSGEMIGTVIAHKKTFEVSWGVLTAAEAKRVEQATTVSSGFFTLEITEYGTATSIRCYRGTITKKVLGYVGDGIFYYRSMTVSFIEK